MATIPLRLPFNSKDLPLYPPAPPSPVDSRGFSSCRASCGSAASDSQPVLRLRRALPRLRTADLPVRVAKGQPQAPVALARLIGNLGRPHGFGCACGCWSPLLHPGIFAYFRPPVSPEEARLRPVASAFFPSAVLLGTTPLDPVPDPENLLAENDETFFYGDDDFPLASHIGPGAARPYRLPTGDELRAVRAIEYAMARATQRVWTEMSRELGIEVRFLQTALWDFRRDSWWDRPGWARYRERLQAVKEEFWYWIEVFSGMSWVDVQYLWNRWAAYL